MLEAAYVFRGVCASEGRKTRVEITAETRGSAKQLGHFLAHMIKSAAK